MMHVFFKIKIVFIVRYNIAWLKDKSDLETHAIMDAHAH